MIFRYRRFAALLVSCVLLGAVSTPLYAKEDAAPDAQRGLELSEKISSVYAEGLHNYADVQDPSGGIRRSAKAARSVGEQIYAKKLQKGISAITVTQYYPGGYKILDTWREGMLGRDTGEWLYCADPNTRFSEGYKTGVPATDYMSEYTVNLIGALMYWYDNNMCAGVNSTDDYLFKQEIVWTMINMEKQWHPGSLYEHGNGTDCDWGHDLYSHRDEIFIDGLAWATENIGRVKTDATVYEGDGQPLMDLTYELVTKGGAKLQKVSAVPELTDGNNCYSPAGAEYRVYTDPGCTDQAGTLITDGSGSSGIIELDAGNYYVQEYSAPEGYALDPSVYPITVTAGQTATLEVQDVPQSAPVEILLQKKDSKTGQNLPRGAASLAGAEFTVCFYPGFYTEVPEIAPVKSWVFRTDDSGRCTPDEDCFVSGDPLYRDPEGKAVLPLGTVTIQETKAPVGYRINEEIFIRQITSEGEGETVDTYNAPDIPEEVICGELRIVKVGRDAQAANGDKKALAGAVFEITSKTTGESVRITTDENGVASSKQAGDLPFDTYVVSEVVTPEGYEPVGDFEVTVSEEAQVLYYTLEDKLITAPVRLVKLDAATGKAIPLAGAAFQLLDSEKQPVALSADDPKDEPRSIFTTDETGSFVLPEKLPVGIYYFREVTAPAGYLISKEDIRFEITESYDWDAPVVVNASDVPAMGRIRVAKTDGSDGKPVAGAVLEVTAAEDIVTPDGTIRLAAGAVADTLTTGKDGQAESRELYLGKYQVREKSAPPGYLLNTSVFDAELKYKDQDTAVFVQNIEIKDEPVKGIIRVVKTDSETGKVIPGEAEFEIRAAEDIITPGGTVHAEKGTIVDTVKTDENGRGSSRELFPGKYTVKEKTAPEGYLLNDRVFDVELSYIDQNTAVVYGDVTVPDSPAMGKIRIIKSDEYTGRLLKDAVFTVTAAEDISTPDGTVRIPKGTVAATLTTGEGGEVESGPLYLGKYILKETKQPAGYIHSPNKEWTVELKYQDQTERIVTGTIEIRNRPTVVIIDKKVTGSDQRLSGVKFAVWNKDDEDPEDPEKTCKYIYRTGRNGQIRLEALEPGHYCIQETEGVPGYAKDPEIHEFVIGEDGLAEGLEEYILEVENKKTEITETEAVSVDTGGKETYPWKKTTVRDTVELINIQPGEEYRMVSALADAQTGELLRENDSSDGVFLKAERRFTGTGPEMTVEMMISFDASAFAGRTVVVYEYLYQDDVKISEHTDPEDEKQQFFISAPRIKTTALAQESGTHEAEAAEHAVIRDSVEYENIIPGSYILRGILMDRQTAEPLLINGENIIAEKEFEITEADGVVENEFILDASGLDGKSMVVYEYLYRKGCEEPAVSHEDINDAGQTVVFRKKIIPQTGDGTDILLPIAFAAAAGSGILLLLAVRLRACRRRNGYRHRKKKMVK